MIRVFLVDKFIGFKTKREIELMCIRKGMTARFKDSIICIVA